MKENWKKFLSILLALVMSVQLVPTTAFATTDDDIVVVGDWEEENRDIAL